MKRQIVGNPNKYIAELERAVEAIPVIGDRYDAEQQKRVLG